MDSEGRERLCTFLPWGDRGSQTFLRSMLSLAYVTACVINEQKSKSELAFGGLNKPLSEQELGSEFWGIMLQGTL